MNLHDKLCLSTIDENAVPLAHEYGLGLELADFCWAALLDENYKEHLQAAERKLQGVRLRWFHAPFAELCPAAIDPPVREHTRRRYWQSVRCARALGIQRLVIHSGFIPYVYYPEWFVRESVQFWRDFLRELPQDMEIALENVMEPDWTIPVQIAQQVHDPRFGLCLDVGHANTCISHMPVLQWIEPMAPYLKHVHLHNNLGEMDLHNGLGEGSLPMAQIIEQLLQSAPSADYTIETMNSNPSLLWLREAGLL